jgi:uncharacterized protein YcfL
MKNINTTKKIFIMKNFKLFILFSTLLLVCNSAQAIVKYDEGRLMIAGVQLLQDREDSLSYYYLPQFPRLSVRPDGAYEFLCMKYVGKGGEETNGGIFHALIEFSLPPEVLTLITDQLKEIKPGAQIVGPVPMQQNLEEGKEGQASFKVISAILNNEGGKDAFTSSVITSGFAPLLPGSKAAIAAKLNQAGATLLWESMSGTTSDVSVAINGYYVAAVKAYNAVVTAEMSTIYNHYSAITNVQSGFTRNQLRKISDKMIQDQVLNIDVFDRSEGLGVSSKEMEAILELVTDKLIELMFDAEAGWSKEPEREVAVEANQIKGRQDRGWFDSVFGGKDDTEYYSDNQFVLKKRKDVRINKFYLNLSKSTTIKVPIYTSGNLAGLYNSLQNKDQYFKIVNLDDPDFQQREVHFQIDGNYAESFGDILNFVSVNFRKKYSNDQSEVTNDISFNAKDVASGTNFKSIKYPRLGLAGSEWLDYEYQVNWSFIGNSNSVRQPANENEWIQARSPSISLIPPFLKRTVEIDLDKAEVQEEKIHSVVVNFYTILSGAPRLLKSITLRNSDPEGTAKSSLYHDTGEPVAYQVVWFSNSGKSQSKLAQLKEDYLFLTPPDKELFAKE